MGLHPRHDVFEREVVTWLEKMGYVVSEMTYHSVLTQEVRDILRLNYTPTAQYIRTRADRIAMNPDTKRCFEFEVKTRYQERNCDFLIELYPYMIHCLLSNMGIDCLYICTLNGDEKGFWADNLDILSHAMIPPQKDEYMVAFYKGLCDSLDVKWRTCYQTMGSNDPFAVIDRNVFDEFPYWKDIIQTQPDQTRPDTVVRENATSYGDPNNAQI